MPSPAYLALLEQMADLHRRKSAGYDGADRDVPFANIREAVDWGSTPLMGTLIRMGDKYRRTQNLIRSAANEQVGESVRETLIDLAAYALIAVVFLDEQTPAAQRHDPPPHRFVSDGYDLGACVYICPDDDLRCNSARLASWHIPS